MSYKLQNVSQIISMWNAIHSIISFVLHSILFLRSSPIVIYWFHAGPNGKRRGKNMICLCIFQCMHVHNILMNEQKAQKRNFQSNFYWNGATFNHLDRMYNIIMLIACLTVRKRKHHQIECAFSSILARSKSK